MSTYSAHGNGEPADTERRLATARVEISRLRHSLLHAEAELANAHWTLARISGRTQYAEHGEDTEDQQALKEIGDEARRGLVR